MRPLCRYDHHPDPAIDFEIEVESIQSIECDAAHGLRPYDGLPDRVARAMDFRVGGDAGAVAAKALLRQIDTRLREKFPDQYR